MPQHNSCKKRNRQDLKKMYRNRRAKNNILDGIKDLKKTDSFKDASEMLPKLYSLLDKAAKKNIIKKGNADRRKARISAFVKKLETKTA